MIDDVEKLELENLERSADEILNYLAGAANEASYSDLLKLNEIAERAAKIAFGSGQADLLSEQMMNLIKWTDHINDKLWVENFLLALRIRPLVNPL